MFLQVGLAACFALCSPGWVLAQDKLDAGGLTFRDFAVNDNGASFSRGDRDPMISGGPNQVSSRIASVETANGLARIQFTSIRVEIAVPLGWQATEDWERGVAYSADKRYRVVVWRVDFPFEGVKDAEHYAATKVGAIQSRHPSVHAQARKLGDGTFLVVYENAPKAHGDGEPREVFDLVRQNPSNPKEGVLLTLGVPASDAVRGLKLMALLRDNMRITW
ncbi:MAG: hypothetical protein JO339_03065 [Alphaproteobacteria bacterium]|nr:hypothetical protein [Alphaproteobacteria bacterium]